MAQGYPDGEVIPLDRLISSAEQIVNAVEVPVSIDFEGGFAKADNELLNRNITRLLKTGVIGINFEDQVMGEGGLYDMKQQMDRIRVIKETTENIGAPLFINSRTDLFLQEKDKTKHVHLISEAKKRGQAYKAAGADGFFAPGLDSLELIEDLCSHVQLPVNILKYPTGPSHQELACCGVGRISYGPFGYTELMGKYQQLAQHVYS